MGNQGSKRKYEDERKQKKRIRLRKRKHKKVTAEDAAEYFGDYILIFGMHKAINSFL